MLNRHLSMAYIRAGTHARGPQRHIVGGLLEASDANWLPICERARRQVPTCHQNHPRPGPRSEHPKNDARTLKKTKQGELAFASSCERALAARLAREPWLDVGSVLLVSCDTSFTSRACFRHAVCCAPFHGCVYSMPSRDKDDAPGYVPLLPTDPLGSSDNAIANRSVGVPTQRQQTAV